MLNEIKKLAVSDISNEKLGNMVRDMLNIKVLETVKLTVNSLLNIIKHDENLSFNLVDYCLDGDEFLDASDITERLYDEVLDIDFVEVIRKSDGKVFFFEKFNTKARGQFIIGKAI